jgi:hypothetical protein
LALKNVVAVLLHAGGELGDRLEVQLGGAELAAGSDAHLTGFDRYMPIFRETQKVCGETREFVRRRRGFERRLPLVDLLGQSTFRRSR